jgi:hypothetical protein
MGEGSCEISSPTGPGFIAARGDLPHPYDTLAVSPDGRELDMF